MFKRILLTSLLFSTALFAQKYTVGVQNFEEYMPYSQVIDGQYQGFNREVLDAFAKDSGIEFEYKPLPIKRLYKEFLEERVDFKYPDSKYWSAQQKEGTAITYSEPVVHYIDGVIVLNSNKGRGIDQFKKLATISGFTPFAWLKHIKEGKVKVHENPNYLGLLRQIVRERADGAYTNIAVSKYYILKANIGASDSSALVFDESLPHTKSTRHMSSIRHPEIIEKFNAWLSEKAALVNKLKQKHKVEEGI